MAKYGYVRVSTATQKVERQIENIKRYCPEAIIVVEKCSGKDIAGRDEFVGLLDKIRKNDELIFDEVSRMSRNAEEGYELYMELISKNIELTFLKETHINSREFLKRMNRHIERVKSDNKHVDKLINGILELVEEFEKDNLKENIRLAFERAENERLYMLQRQSEGYKALKERGEWDKIGRPTLEMENIEKVKELINTGVSIVEACRTVGIGRSTWYKYKKGAKSNVFSN